MTTLTTATVSGTFFAQRLSSCNPVNTELQACADTGVVRAPDPVASRNQRAPRTHPFLVTSTLVVSVTLAPVPTGAVPVPLIQTVKLALQVPLKRPAHTSLQGAGSKRGDVRVQRRGPGSWGQGGSPLYERKLEFLSYKSCQLLTCVQSVHNMCLRALFRGPPGSLWLLSQYLLLFSLVPILPLRSPLLTHAGEPRPAFGSQLTPRRLFGRLQSMAGG